jgi:hypothetical protein
MPSHCTTSPLFSSAYGDGAEFHHDYYNSFVIQPMLVDILNGVRPYRVASRNAPQKFYESFFSAPAIVLSLTLVFSAVACEESEWAAMLPTVLRRAVRYAEVQERMIAPDGTFAPLGRSLAYRCVRLQQHLSECAALLHASSSCMMRSGVAPLISLLWLLRKTRYLQLCPLGR